MKAKAAAKYLFQYRRPSAESADFARPRKQPRARQPAAAGHIGGHYLRRAMGGRAAA